MSHRTLIHIVSSNSWGGPERYALDICRHFRKEGWRVKVVTKETKDVDSRFEEAGIYLRHAPLRDYLDIFSALILRKMMHPIPIGEGIVHVHTYHDAMTAAIARRLARRPDIRIVSTCHKAQRAPDSYLHRKVYDAIDAHIFVSEFALSRFLSGWTDGNVPIPAGRIHVAYNSLLLPDEYRQPVATPVKGPVTAMFRGRLQPGKGLDTLIDALSLLKDIKLRLRIVGAGAPDYTDALRQRAQKRGVMERIDWIRRADDAMPLIRDSHFGVFPAVEPEAFGMTNMEFMACGRAQISTLTGGQKEFLTNGVETLEVLPADAQSLAAAMRLLATVEEKRRSLGEAAALKYESELSWPIFIGKLSEIYEMALESGR